MNQPNEKQYNYFYRITNQINWKFYFGIHSTNNLNDNYFGGGTALKRAIKKYGKGNFHLTIIETYSTRKEASDHERLVVTHEMIENDMCYNLRCGGDNENAHSDDFKRNLSNKYKGCNNPFYGKKHTDELKAQLKKNNTGETNPFYGKHHSDEFKRKLSTDRKGTRMGTHHPLYGIPVSEETKRKLSLANTGKKRSEEYKLQKSESMMGELNPFYGKKHTEESRKKIKEARANQVFSEEVQIKKSEASKGTKNHFYGKKHSAESLEKMRNNKSNAKQCKIDDVIYNSISTVSRELNLSYSIVRKRITSKLDKWSKWTFVNNP